MAVTLRLARGGFKKNPYYRIVAAERTGFRRDGRCIEIVGSYKPTSAAPLVKINEERARYWLEKGALPTETVRRLLMKALPGEVEKRESHRLEKIRSARRKRKERAKKGAKSGK